MNVSLYRCKIEKKLEIVIVSYVAGVIALLIKFAHSITMDLYN